MGFFSSLFGKTPKDRGSGVGSQRVVVFDNRSPDDNWIVNETGVAATVACTEMFGSFEVDLCPGESRRVTCNGLRANVYPAGKARFDDLKYEFGKCEKWAVRKEQATLVLVKVSG